MLLQLKEMSAHSIAACNDRRVCAALVFHALFLVGCASPAFERNAAASNDDPSKGRIDSRACSAHHEPLTVLLGESMLLGMTFGGGRALIESEKAEKRKAFKKCMDARQGQPVT